MTEARQINDAVRHHLGPLGRWKRIECSIEPGVPDWYYRLRGVAGWLEAKLVPESRKCPPAFTLEQLLWAEDEVRFGGLWHLLGLTPSRTWLLLDVRGARSWYEGAPAEAVFAARGAFPTVELHRRLAPSAFGS